MIAKPDPTKYPVPPHKPKKSDFYRALILNTLLSKNVDPENHVDKALFTKKVEKDLTKGKAKRGKHRMPELPRQQPALQQNRASTPIQKSTGSTIDKKESVNNEDEGLASTTSAWCFKWFGADRTASKLHSARYSSISSWSSKFPQWGAERRKRVGKHPGRKYCGEGGSVPKTGYWRSAGGCKRGELNFRYFILPLHDSQIYVQACTKKSFVVMIHSFPGCCSQTKTKGKSSACPTITRSQINPKYKRSACCEIRRSCKHHLPFLWRNV